MKNHRTVAPVSSPLQQFEIKRVVELSAGGFDISLTNSSLWMLASLALIWIFMVGGSSGAKIIPGRWQAAVESIYEFVEDMLNTNIGPEGRRYVPLIFSLFMFVLV
jgi:F-type H+-transporting ATPase subunit a